MTHAGEPSAADFFAVRVHEYDSLISRGAPRYAEMLDELIDCVPADATRVLELGCGTGALTLKLVERCPDAELTIVDAAQEMIDTVTERLGHTGSRPALVTSRFEELDLDTNAYDCITSSMALHHVVDKRPLYRRLRQALTDGGVFAFADELVGEAPSIQDRFWDRWIEFARTPGHLSEEEIREIIEHMEAFDRYETLPRQMELLRNAGFESVDCVWRYLNYAVFVAS